MIRKSGRPRATLLAVKPFGAKQRSLLKRHSAAILIAAAWAFGNAKTHAADRHAPSIIVRFEPVMINGRNAFHVIESFRAQQLETEIIVPNHWGSAAHLEDQTQNLKIDSPGAALTNHPLDDGHRVLHARTGERVQLSYDIVPQQTEWFRHPQEHMAIINTDYFLFNPENALVYPEMPHTGEVDVTLDWRALPKNIPIITSFGIIRALERQRVIRARAPWYQILDCLVAGGNFRISESNANGTTVVLAIRGIWKFSDADALRDVRRILEEENRFWRAVPMHHFLVTLAPFDDRWWQHTNDGIAGSVQINGASHDAWISAKVAIPCGSAQYDNMVAGWSVVLLVDHTADEGRNPQQREEVAGHDHAMYLLGMSVHHERNGIGVDRGIRGDL